MSRAGRLPVVIVLIVALAATGLTRWWADSLRGAGRPAASRRAELSQLDSFTLGLLLGGLRGPLVMALWSTSETQKGERDLQDFDTKIELIRLLQPQFDTVHLFQIWNKAYNISVQMANLPSKYGVILDALDYGFSVRQERPDNINLEAAVANVMFGKLGKAAENQYYRQRVREETLPPTEMTRITFPQSRRTELAAAAAQVGLLPEEALVRQVAGKPGALSLTLRKPAADRLKPTFSGPDVAYEDRPGRAASRDETGRRIRYDTLLDDRFNLLPKFTTPTDPNRPQGAELYYLKPFEPFDEGVSPLALAYNYYMRAQALQTEQQQVHAQLSPRVLDSRSAVSLAAWAEDDRERALRSELATLGKPLPTDKNDQEAASAMLRAGAKVGPGGLSRALLERASYNDRRAAMLADAAVDEFTLHVGRFPGDAASVQAQADQMRMLSAAASADVKYLALLLDPANASRGEVVAAYKEAAYRIELNTLRYYVDDAALAKFYPPGVDKPELDRRAKLDALSPGQLDQMWDAVQEYLKSPAGHRYFQQEMSDNGLWLKRVRTRLAYLSTPA